MSNFSQMLGNRAEAQRIYEQRKKIKWLERKLQQKDDIIKEVREWSKKLQYETINASTIRELLEILDKVDKEK